LRKLLYRTSNMNGNMSQKSEILAMLKEGNCTTHRIVEMLGNGAVRRLRTLREEGYPIEKQWLSPTNYAYRLVESPVRASKRSKRIDAVVTQSMPTPVKRASTRKVDERIISDLEWWDRKRWELSRMLWRI
jgi:hypothetical protein